MKIHTTVGVYADESYKINGVLHELLKGHIKYNIENRPGRALFVDGRCVYSGNLSKERCAEWVKKIAADPVTFKRDHNTSPYV